MVNLGKQQPEPTTKQQQHSPTSPRDPKRCEYKRVASSCENTKPVAHSPPNGYNTAGTPEHSTSEQQAGTENGGTSFTIQAGEAFKLMIQKRRGRPSKDFRNQIEQLKLMNHKVEVEVYPPVGKRTRLPTWLSDLNVDIKNPCRKRKYTVSEKTRDSRRHQNGGRGSAGFASMVTPTEPNDTTYPNTKPKNRKCHVAMKAVDNLKRGYLPPVPPPPASKHRHNHIDASSYVHLPSHSINVQRTILPHTHSKHTTSQQPLFPHYTSAPPPGDGGYGAPPDDRMKSPPYHDAGRNGSNGGGPDLRHIYIPSNDEKLIYTPEHVRSNGGKNGKLEKIFARTRSNNNNNNRSTSNGRTSPSQHDTDTDHHEIKADTIDLRDTKSSMLLSPNSTLYRSLRRANGGVSAATKPLLEQNHALIEQKPTVYILPS